MAEEKGELSFEYKPALAWMACIAAMLFYLLGSASSNMLTPVNKLILEALGQDTNFTSTMTMASTLSSLVITAFLGALMNRFGFRKVGYAGYICLLICGGIAALGSNEGVLIASQIFGGLGYAVPCVLGTYVLTQWFPESKRGVPIALVASCAPLAKIVTSQMSKITIPLGGWQAQFYGYALLVVIGLVLYVFFMKAGPGYEAAEAARIAKSEKKDAQEKAPIIEVLKNPAVWAISLVNFFFIIGMRGFSPFANMVYVQNCGVDNNTASDIWSIFSFAQLFSGLLYGWILSKFVKKRGTIMAILITVYLFGCCSLFVINQAWMAYLFNFGVGLLGGVVAFCNVCMPLFFRSPAVLATAMSIYVFIGKFFGGLVAPYVFSITQNIRGLWTDCAYPMLVCAVIGTVCVWYLGVRMNKMAKEGNAETAKAE